MYFVLFSLEDIKTEIMFFPKNATHLLIPADAFDIKKIKKYSAVSVIIKKLEMLSSGMWLNSENGSGKLTNPGKRFILNMALETLRRVNR